MSQTSEVKLNKASRAQAAGRAIVALMLREMSTRYGRTPGGYIWAMLEPLGMIILLSAAFSLMARAPSMGTSFLLFKGTGFMILQVFTLLGGQIGNSLSFSKSLLQYPRVTWGDAIIARFLLNFLVISSVTVIILTGIVIYEDLDILIRWHAVFLAFFLTAALGLGIGVLNCFLFMRMPVWRQIWSIITRPLFLISGVILIYEDMPDFAQEILWYNPLIHLTGLMRVGFYPMYRPEYISFTFIGLAILVPMTMGLILLRRYHRELLSKK